MRARRTFGWKGELSSKLPAVTLWNDHSDTCFRLADAPEFSNELEKDDRGISNMFQDMSQKDFLSHESGHGQGKDSRSTTSLGAQSAILSMFFQPSHL